MELNKDNYHDKEFESRYMTYSQFKGFLECEAQELAILEGRFEKPTTDALLQGSYFDAHFSGELEQFKEKNPTLFKKDGTLLAKYEICQKAIEAVEQDPFLLENFFLNGQVQEVVVGEINGVPFKGKIDYVGKDKLVDWKLMKDTDDVWDATQWRRVPFYEFYKYNIEGAIFQELYRQKTGLKLPFYLAVVTKTDPVEKKVFRFSQIVLDQALEVVKAFAPHYLDVKNHVVEPEECEKCNYYKQTHKLNLFDIIEIEE